MIPFRFPDSLPPLPGAALVQNLLESVQPPPWVVAEVQNRLVLFLNHVLQQEPAAQSRVRQQRGRVVRVVWGRFELTLRATPAGLLERAASAETPDSAAVDLTVTVADESIWPLLQTLARGDKPRVTIEGDVQLASEVAWLADNVRWDVEEDLSRVLGDAAAYRVVSAARAGVAAVRAFGLRAPGSGWAPTA